MDNLKERPILFSTEMVQAILAGRKTQTRRILKVTNPLVNQVIGFSNEPDTMWPADYGFGVLMATPWLNYEAIKCPYGAIGDTLWVRETWAKNGVLPLEDRTDAKYIYKAERSEVDGKVKYAAQWKPSIHMPKEACRLRLTIKDIRVERVQDISQHDAIKEGVECDADGKGYYLDYMNLADGYGCSPKYSFQSLWHKINGEESWYANVWVWVIEFEIKK